MQDLFSRDVPFPGLMMERPLLISSILERAGQMFASQEIVEYQEVGSFRITVGEVVQRARRLASSLSNLGIRPGDRVATFCWNTHRHLEMFLGVPSMGAVLVPLNVRLHDDDLTYIVRHSGAKVLVVDASLADRVPEIDGVEIRIVVDDRDDKLVGGVRYEDLIDSGNPNHEFEDFSEFSASTICYTSGSTGRPKGVVYSHRSTVLHTLLQSLPDFYDIRESDTVLPIAPFFHGNAWGIPYAAMMAGARIVMSGPRTSPQEVVDMIAAERVTFAGAIVTIWHGVGQLGDLPDLSSLRQAVAGGAPVPESMLRRFDELGIPLIQGFGLTETNPLLSVGRVPARSTASDDERIKIRASQGRPVPLVDIRRDEEAGGELLLRGSTIASGYFHGEASDRFTEDGWMRTGDIAEISTDGVIRIVDRTKDMVKSGGEWISSVELESAIMGHPAVLEASVVAAPDTRWGERPYAFIVTGNGLDIEQGELRDYLASRVARWWVPENIEFVESIPKTPSGKFDKRRMRDRAAAATRVYSESESVTSE